MSLIIQKQNFISLVLGEMFDARKVHGNFLTQPNIFFVKVFTKQCCEAICFSKLSCLVKSTWDPPWDMLVPFVTNLYYSSLSPYLFPSICPVWCHLEALLEHSYHTILCMLPWRGTLFTDITRGTLLIC